jgi:elongation factor Ts
VRFDVKADSVLGEYLHRVDHKTGVLVELQGDPNNAAQKEVARNIAMHVAFTKPKYLNRDEIPAAEVERERAVLIEKTRNEGKPEAAIPKIVEGRIGKFYEDNALVDQPYVRDQSKKIGLLAQEAGATLRRFALFVVGQE